MLIKFDDVHACVGGQTKESGLASYFASQIDATLTWKVHELNYARM